jgi:transposase-like protein
MSMTIHHKPTKCPVCKQEQEIVELGGYYVHW